MSEPIDVERAVAELQMRHVELVQAFRTVSGCVLAGLICDGKIDRGDLLQRFEAFAVYHGAELERLGASPGAANQNLLDLVEDLKIMDRFELINGGKNAEGPTTPSE
jgi:hypothetical protein